MSNSPLVSYTKLSPNNGGKRNHVIDTITIHCTAGNGTAFSLLNLSHFVNYNTKTGASCNYAIGYDGSIGLGVDEANRSWCTSNRNNDDRAITIEVSSEATHPYKVSGAAYNALMNLLVDICQRNGIKKLVWSTSKNDRVNHVNGCNMTVHRDYANKACPGDYLYNLHGQIAAEVNKKLHESEDEDNMTVDRFKELCREMRKEAQDNDSSEWSAEAREWAVSSGLVQGGSDGEPNYMWEDVMTREQLVTVLHRFANLMGMA